MSDRIADWKNDGNCGRGSADLCTGTSARADALEGSAENACSNRSGASQHASFAESNQKTHANLKSRLKITPSHSWKNLLPGWVIDQLNRRFSPMRVEYIARVLSAGEIQVLADIGDALIIARIKNMQPARLKRFDAFVPTNSETQRKYCAKQAEWIRSEDYLLGTRLGRQPTHRELHADFLEARNGMRFRAYFVLRYPSMMVRKPHRSRPCN